MKSDHDGKCAFVQVDKANGDHFDVSVLDATGPADARYWIVFTLNGSNGDITTVNQMRASAPTVGESW